jgi:hypothetical protein
MGSSSRPSLDRVQKVRLYGEEQARAGASGVEEPAAPGCRRTARRCGGAGHVRL